MSTPSATARYVIAADDKSGNALKSVIRGFKDMDRDVRGTVKTLNAVLGIFVGVQLTQAFRKVVDATASASAGSSGFAQSLREVKSAAADLLVARSGLPEATKNLNELRDVLKDPSIKSAADALTSSLISGFAKTAKFVAETVAGIRQLSKDPSLANAKTRQDVIDALDKQIEEVDAKINRARQGVGGLSAYDDNLRTAPGTYDSLDEAALVKQRASLLAAQQRALDAAPFSGGKGHGTIPVTSNDVLQSATADRLAREEDKRHEDFMRGINEEIAAYKVKIVGHEQSTKAILNETERYLDQQVAVKDLDAIDINAIEAKKIFVKSVDDDIKAMAEIAKEAARGMYSAFEQFFFDPFRGGLKGLAGGLLDVLRHAAAAQAALATLNYLSSFGSSGKNAGKGGVVGSIVGALFGGYKASGGPLEEGKWYTAGENGPERIWGGGPGAFAAGSGGHSVVINNYMDNRGATTDLIAQLPAVMRANNDALKADIMDTISRRPPASLRR